MATGLTLGTLKPQFGRALRAENKSPRTVDSYLESVTLLERHLAEHGRSEVVTDITRGDVEAFIVDQLARHKPATALSRFKGCRVFFGWLEDEEEIDTSPMVRMKPPKLTETTVAIITDDEFRKLLKACAGRGFEERRDTAVISLLADTGIRRNELIGLTLDDLDLDERLVRVMGKGRRPRAVPFGAKTAQSVDRYLRVRSTHVLADQPDLWLGTSGRRWREYGLRQMLRRRGDQAGVTVHPHQFRHSFAHNFLAAGGNEGDLMRLTGWKSRTMIDRYGASAASERARASYASPVDRL